MRHHFSTNEVDVFYHSRTARLLLIVFTSLLPAIFMDQQGRPNLTSRRANLP